MRWILTFFLTLAIWQLVRFGAFEAVVRVDSRPPAFASLDRTITLFGASNFSRPPFADELRAALQGCATLRVVAKAGANSDWAVTQAARAFQEGGIVIIAFTGNDASLLRGMPLARSLENHRLLVERAEKAGASVIHVIGGPPFHGLRGMLRPGSRAYAETVAQLKGGVLDEGRLLPPGTDVMSDGLHVDPTAVSAYVVPAYAEALRSLVCQAVLPPSTVRIVPVTRDASSPNR